MDFSERLGRHDGDDTVSKLVSRVIGWAPGAPELPAWTEIDAETEARASSRDARRVLWVLDALDEGEGVLSIASGFGTALRLALGKGPDGERGGLTAMEARQWGDAAEKVLGVSLAVSLCFPGPPEARVAALRSMPAGRAVLSWLAMAEVLLPFADEVVAGKVASRLEACRAGARAQLAAVVSEAEAAAADEQWPSLLAAVAELAAQRAALPFNAAGLLAEYLPSVFGVVDASAAVAAGAFDALPVYRMLATRLVAEVAVAGEFPGLEVAAVAEPAPVVEPAAVAPVADPVLHAPTVDEPPVTPPDLGEPVATSRDLEEPVATSRDWEEPVVDAPVASSPPAFVSPPEVTRDGWVHGDELPGVVPEGFDDSPVEDEGDEDTAPSRTLVVDFAAEGEPVPEVGGGTTAPSSSEAGVPPPLPVEAPPPLPEPVPDPRVEPPRRVVAPEVKRPILVERPPEPEPEARGSGARWLGLSIGAILVAAVLCVGLLGAAGAGWWWYTQRGMSVATPATPTTAPAQPAPAQPAPAYEPSKQPTTKPGGRKGRR